MTARDDYRTRIFAESLTPTSKPPRRQRVRAKMAHLRLFAKRVGRWLALDFKNDPQYRTRYLDGSEMPVNEMKMYRSLTYTCWALELAIAAVAVVLIVFLITGS